MLPGTIKIGKHKCVLKTLIEYIFVIAFWGSTLKHLFRDYVGHYVGDRNMVHLSIKEAGLSK